MLPRKRKPNLQDDKSKPTSKTLELDEMWTAILDIMNIFDPNTDQTQEANSELVSNPSGSSVSGQTEVTVSYPTRSSAFCQGSKVIIPTKYKTKHKDGTRYIQSVEEDNNNPPGSSLSNPSGSSVSNPSGSSVSNPSGSSVSNPPGSSVSNPSGSSVSNPPGSSVSNPSGSSVSNPSGSSVSNPSGSSVSNPPESSVSNPPGSSVSNPSGSSVPNPSGSSVSTPSGSSVSNPSSSSIFYPSEASTSNPPGPSTSNPSGSSASNQGRKVIRPKKYKAKSTERPRYNPFFEEDDSDDEEIKHEMARELMRGLFLQPLKHSLPISSGPSVSNPPGSSLPNPSGSSVSNPSQASTSSQGHQVIPSKKYKAGNTDRISYNDSVEEDDDDMWEHEEGSGTDDNVLTHEQNEEDEDIWVTIGSGRTVIHKDIIKNVDWTSFTLATKSLLEAVFPKRVLATHTRTGRPSSANRNRSPKPRLHARKTDDIIMEIKNRFNVKESAVKKVISIKCAEERKAWRKEQPRGIKKNPVSHKSK